MKIKLIPKWMFAKYAQLYKQFRLEAFDIEDVMHDPSNITPDIIFRLRKAGWLTSDFNPDDRRLRQYTLVDPALIAFHVDIPAKLLKEIEEKENDDGSRNADSKP